MSDVLVVRQANGEIALVFGLGSEQTFSCRMKLKAAEKVGKELIMTAHELRKEGRVGQKGRKKGENYV